MPASHRRGPKTARLSHRAFEPGDADAFFALNSHPEVMKYTGEPPFESSAAALEAIQNYPDFERYGFGRWACVLEEENRVIGFSGLKYLEDLDAVDLGYRFLPEYWGRGLATESGRACLEYAFHELDLEEVIGLVLRENKASVHVLEKLGFSFVGEIEYEDLPGVLKFAKRR